jgi:hypothetical protein
MSNKHKLGLEKFRARLEQEEFRMAFERVINLQGDIFELGGDSSQDVYVYQLHATAFLVTRLMADNFRPSELPKSRSGKLLSRRSRL